MKMAGRHRVKLLKALIRIIKTITFLAILHRTLHYMEQELSGGFPRKGRTGSLASASHHTGSLASATHHTGSLASATHHTGSLASATHYQQKKKILLWGKYYGGPWPALYANGSVAFGDLNCEYQNCAMVRERSAFRYADAILFRAIDLNLGDLPPVRYDWQRYILYGAELPAYTGITKGGIRDFYHSDPLKNLFNWTVSYRSDADVYGPYGFIRSVKPHKPDYDYMGNKTKLAAWVVKKCQGVSGREKLVKQLQKYIPIDIYGEGDCHTHDLPAACDRGPGSVGECIPYITSNYKFYLGLENGICKDWVTEKWFDWHDKNIIVVQLASKDISLMPQDAVINALDYSSARELAEKMLSLANNRSKYNDFFKWRNTYDIRCPERTGEVRRLCRECETRWCDSCGYTRNTLCGLCEKLNTNTSYSSYPDFRHWWDKCDYNDKYWETL